VTGYGKNPSELWLEGVANGVTKMLDNGHRGFALVLIPLLALPIQIEHLTAPNHSAKNFVPCSLADTTLGASTLSSLVTILLRLPQPHSHCSIDYPYRR
jgi:hypothetical protein